MSFPDIPLAAIHAVCADEITYTGPGLALDPIDGIYSNEAADPFAGKGKSARIVSFEIQYEDLPRKPGSDDRIVHRTGTWAPIDVVELDDVCAWLVTVQKAS